MKLNRRIAILLALALALAATPALAMPVSLGGAMTTTVATNVADGSSVNLVLQDFHLLGTNSAGEYLVYANNSYYAVAPVNMGAALAALPADAVAALPGTNGMETVAYGSEGASVRALQTALQTLGYLEGAVDGDFGRGTERALVAFQAAIGAPQNGVANPMQQLLAQSMATPAQPAAAPQAQQQGGGTMLQLLGGLNQAQPQPAAPEAPAAPAPSNEGPFAPIAGRTEANLQPIYDSGLAFAYDDMLDEGFISDGSAMSYDLSDGTDIGKYQLTVQFGLLTRPDKNGVVTINPAIKFSCLCIRRPVMTDVIVKSGEDRGTCGIKDLSCALEGINSVESGIATLNEKAVAAMINCVETGELKLRVNGRYNSFDVQVGDEYLAYISRLGILSQQIQNTDAE